MGESGIQLPLLTTLARRTNSSRRCVCRTIYINALEHFQRGDPWRAAANCMSTKMTPDEGQRQLWHCFGGRTTSRKSWKCSVLKTRDGLGRAWLQIDPRGNRERTTCAPSCRRQIMNFWPMGGTASYFWNVAVNAVTQHWVNARSTVQWQSWPSDRSGLKHLSTPKIVRVASECQESRSIWTKFANRRTLYQASHNEIIC